MGDALKTFFSPAFVRRLAGDLARVHPTFPIDAFIKSASTGLKRLELLDRGRQIARALARHLPRAYLDAIDVLPRSLGPEHAGDELIGAGMAPFFYLPHTIFVAEHGLEHFDLSMRAQYELTKRFSAESSIRTFIRSDPERAFAWLERWVDDGNAHVRRRERRVQVVMSWTSSSMGRRRRWGPFTSFRGRVHATPHSSWRLPHDEPRRRVLRPRRGQPTHLGPQRALVGRPHWRRQ